MVKYLPKPENYPDYYYIDIETTLIPPEGPKGVQTIWMMCASRMDSDEVLSFVGHSEIRRFFDEVPKTATFVGHNAISFDGPVIQRVCGPRVDSSNTVDTLILSYLYNPGLLGGHSLAAWGDRFHSPKIDFNDFSKYSQEMDWYCQQDVKLGKKVFKGLVERMRKMGFSEKSCEIEHQIREVIDEQQDNGWYFDIPGAQALVGQLRREQADLEPGIRELFPRQLVEVGTYPRRSKKDGGEFASYLRHLGQFPELRDNGDGTYSTFDWQEFNIGSPKQRVDRLLELGWEPQSFTEKGFPKVDEDSLVAFSELSGRPEARAIADWLVLQGRASMLDGWLNNVNYNDSCMHGQVLTCAAMSRRMIHFKPNSANIPKAKKKVKYGIECRSLWRARPGRLEVGSDASGLEMRMFAEYLKNDAATILFTTGDPHLLNTRNLKLPDDHRDLTVKNGFYAYLYGAGDPKLGRTLRPELQADEAREYGKWARGVLERGTPGLARLVADIEDEYRVNGGVLKTIDGGYVRCGSRSAALNYKLQSAGAIVMKQAAIHAKEIIKQRGLDSLLVGTIHDENQDDVAPADAEEVGKVRVQSIRDAGETLGFKVPLDGNYKVGANWAETH
jgi:DNA polymerase I-like protein with 3'-5' exonuclease and polymerase domains